MKKIIRDKTYNIVKKLTNDPKDRYIVIILEQNKQRYFYKELNHDDVDHFQEQIAFQKQVLKSDKNIILPKLFDYELEQKRKWGLWEFLEGEHLAEWCPKDIKEFERWLEPIVDCLVELEKIPPFPAEIDIVDKMILRINQWSQEPIKQGLYSLVDKEKISGLIQKNRSKISVGFNHSDFVPWHMHEIEFPKFALVDYENCKNKPRYYDVAYFYHRVYTKMGEPGIAQKFMDIFKKQAKLPSDFSDRFLPVLGQRIIGGFFDCLVNKDRTNLLLHKKLLRDCLAVIS